MNLAQSLNHRALDLCHIAKEQSHLLDIEVSKFGGVTVLDFGAQNLGQLASGLMLARICMSDLATVNLGYDSELGLPEVSIHTDHPLSACIASQYAGWSFSDKDFFAMASGAARMCRGQEELLEEFELQQPSEVAVAVLETSQLPTESICQNFLHACSANQGVLCVARTASLPGTLQVVARSVETALHKLHEVGWDLRTVRSGLGTAPLPPIAKDDFTALGWTNDAILYGGRVNLWVDVDEAKLKELGPKIPSCSSDSFGRPFAELFAAADHDFYKMDKLLFSPASVVFHNIRSGMTHSFGQRRTDLLKDSFGVGGESS